ncbi:MAG: 2-oxoglutarate dehydrogenase [Bacteroidetes bacterium GWE2_41_25]|nr:MAG: 2-oxoglutarate dehydrogenase [Bacteroidetes bacterium GWA2_40_15]OFX89733.1 MAG: 2-oxoglutarate dehydrogenase [Bacteroidetes bacterium GWC2_40_22]OFY00639.1 MAG: 2-oxoglutarate dehydrogenase [Bacteroidetes bacterium GWE2_41_25]OFY61334.1 MAG: 2-oxoglutarate dehydrogenase [Bacteroidetes bacterium GWF2_41_9]HAM09448.1 2-oxoglutarate dehydrogenase [Bacteroidales bacterium]
MARMNITLPAMGEGIIEATINKWLVKEGSVFREDDPLVEVATDKVDSEIPAPAAGTLVSIIAPEGTVAKIGDVIAIAENDYKPGKDDTKKIENEVKRIRETIETVRKEEAEVESVSHEMKSRTPSGKFISPLVRSIAAKEGISYADLDGMKGTGMDGRITRDDVFQILTNRKKRDETHSSDKQKKPSASIKSSGKITDGDEIIQMDRVRMLIAEHMVMSKRTSAHVTSFIDADVTRLVKWRNANKDSFLASEGQKLTLTPIFIDAAARALYELPMINISVDGDKIIRKKNINIGMAAALPDGNLIVPVIKNANEKNLTGLAKAVNDLAERARNNKLKPEEITGGTFTITNFGSYNNLAGTPIINQPQAAILGTGVVKKTPAVIETPDGDMIAIRSIIILSLSYDHRVIDGALAGKFLSRVKEILENYTSDLS